LQDALIDLTNRGEIVLDPFLGSGSTLLAAGRQSRLNTSANQIISTVQNIEIMFAS
jgi:DNA modification methylase